MVSLQQIMMGRRPPRNPFKYFRDPPPEYPYLPNWLHHPTYQNPFPSLYEDWLYQPPPVFPPIKSPPGSYPPGWGSSGWAWGQGAHQQPGRPSQFKAQVPPWPNFYPPPPLPPSYVAPWKPLFDQTREA